MDILTAKGYVNFGKYGGHDDQRGCLRFDLAVTKGRDEQGNWVKDYLHLTCWDDSGLTEFINEGDYIMVEYYVKPRVRDGKTYQNATVKQVWVRPDVKKAPSAKPVYSDIDLPF